MTTAATPAITPADFRDGTASTGEGTAVRPLPVAGDTDQAVVHGSPGAAPASPAHIHSGTPGGSVHSPAPHRDRAERAAGTGSSGGDAPRRTGRSSREEASERSLRSLVTTRSTQLSPTAALRGREVALPSADDLAAAEEGLVIVRRHYVPPTALTTGRRQDWPNRRGGGDKGASNDR